jgi:hypothetical protein
MRMGNETNSDAQTSLCATAGHRSVVRDSEILMDSKFEAFVEQETRRAFRGIHTNDMSPGPTTFQMP